VLLGNLRRPPCPKTTLVVSWIGVCEHKESFRATIFGRTAVIIKCVGQTEFFLPSYGSVNPGRVNAIGHFVIWSGWSFDFLHIWLFRRRSYDSSLRLPLIRCGCWLLGLNDHGHYREQKKAAGDEKKKSACNCQRPSFLLSFPSQI